MSTLAQKSSMRIGMGPNPSLWEARPLMYVNPDGSFTGRVFVEVYDEAVHVVIGGDEVPLINAALAALKSGQTPLGEEKLPWTNQPATGGIEGQDFLGRAVIEVWSNGAVVGITGTEKDAIVERAIRRLTALS